MYGIDILDHRTGQVIPNDYVGQTRQKGRARENQHRDDKPWSDRIVGSPRVLWEGDCTDADLDEMERRFIQDVDPEKRPRMNWQLNEDNPRQIPKWVQVEQRHARDDAAGVERWQPPEQRTSGGLLDVRSEPRWPTQSARFAPVVRSAHPWVRPASIWFGAWGLVAAVAWGYLARSGLNTAWTTEALSASLTATTMCLWGFAGAPITRRQRRAARRRVGRWVRRWWGQ